MKLLEAKYLHFIGIGGIGTSSLAQILAKKGKKISGSDETASDLTKSLKLSKIKVQIGHKASNVNKKHQMVIYSPAVPDSNVELVQAKKLKIQTLTYPQALGELTKEHYTIAIAGSHGKSTTTAMIAKIAENSGLDPTVVIGTKMKEFKNRNFRIGESNYLIIEACEYKDSFLNFDPNILIITNIEADHLDYFKTFENYKKTFEHLSKKVSKDGTVIINADDKNSKSVTKNIKAQVTTWSAKNKRADYFLDLKNKELKYKDLIKNIDEKIKINPSVTGEFNMKNGACAAIAGMLLNVEKSKIEQSLKLFKGTWRRMQYKKKKGFNCEFIDDYGHHPTEITLTLAAIREEHPGKKILCVFQPHQYSRTRLLLKEFGSAFTEMDEVIIPDIYRVRDTEEDVKSVSVKDLVNEIKKYNKHAKDGGGMERTAEFIKKNHKNYDLVVTMGAGNIEDIYKMM